MPAPLSTLIRVLSAGALLGAALPGEDLSRLPMLKNYTSDRVSSYEHGHANHRSDNFYTVAYWYQHGRHRLRQPLPPVQDRIPRMINTAGPTMGKP